MDGMLDGERGRVIGGEGVTRAFLDLAVFMRLR
jgi:hypothetical protein